MKHEFDIVIAGGGMVGTGLACLLAQRGYRLAVIEKYPPKAFFAAQTYDLRVSAINRASQQLLTQAGAWADIVAMRSSPYTDMHVWDSTGAGEIHFSSFDLGEENLGHIIENRVIQLALMEQLQQRDEISLYCPDALQHFVIEDDQVSLQLSSGDTLSTKLLIGADGARSHVRRLANIAVDRQYYQQHGVVAIIGTEEHHQYTAWQRFMPDGPLAFLPLASGESSIVWTLPTAKAQAIVDLKDEAFKAALGEAFERRLGRIESASQRASFPFQGTQARAYVKHRIALIGDAAHTIHPLAGQGVNLGFRDVKALNELLADKPYDPGEYGLLRRYERSRRGDSVLTMRMMEGFNHLFGNTFAPLQFVRNFGLNAVNAAPFLKQQLMKQAMGVF